MQRLSLKSLPIYLCDPSLADSTQLSKSSRRNILSYPNFLGAVGMAIPEHQARLSHRIDSAKSTQLLGKEIVPGGLYLPGTYPHVLQDDEGRIPLNYTAKAVGSLSQIMNESDASYYHRDQSKNTSVSSILTSRKHCCDRFNHQECQLGLLSSSTCHKIQRVNCLSLPINQKQKKTLKSDASHQSGKRDIQKMKILTNVNLVGLEQPDNRNRFRTGLSISLPLQHLMNQKEAVRHLSNVSTGQRPQVPRKVCSNCHWRSRAIKVAIRCLRRIRMRTWRSILRFPMD